MKLLKYTIELTERELRLICTRLLDHLDKACTADTKANAIIETYASDVALFDELQNILPKYKLIYEDLRERLHHKIEEAKEEGRVVIND